MTDREMRCIRMLETWETLVDDRRYFSNFAMNEDALSAVERLQIAQPLRVNKDRMTGMFTVGFDLIQLHKYLMFICKQFKMDVNVDGTITTYDGITIPLKYREVPPATSTQERKQMKIDFSQQLKNLDGVGLHENGNPVTLGLIACAALLAGHPDDARLDGEEKFQRYELAAKIHHQAEVTVTAEDIGRMKAVIGRNFNTELVGPAYRALNVQAAPEAAPAAAAPTPIATSKTPAKARRKLASVPETDDQT